MCLGIPGCIQEVYQLHSTRMGRCLFGAISKEVCLEYLPEAQVGDYVIVHAGFAITQLDRASAEDTLRLLQELGRLEEELTP